MPTVPGALVTTPRHLLRPPPATIRRHSGSPHRADDVKNRSPKYTGTQSLSVIFARKKVDKRRTSLALPEQGLLQPLLTPCCTAPRREEPNQHWLPWGRGGRQADGGMHAWIFPKTA